MLVTLQSKTINFVMNLHVSFLGLYSGPFATQIIQGGSGSEPEPETGTVGTVFPGTETGTGTALSA